MVIGCTAAAAARSRSRGAVAISSRGSLRIIAFTLGPCSYKLHGDFPCRDTAGALDSPWLRDSILNPARLAVRALAVRELQPTEIGPMDRPDESS
jgi:hypothetical protein